MGPAGSTFFGFARTHLLKDEVRPFMYGILVAFIGLGRLSFNSDPVARAGRAIRGLLERALQLRGGRPLRVCRSRASPAAAATSCPLRILGAACCARSRLTRASCVLHRLARLQVPQPAQAPLNGRSLQPRAGKRWRMRVTRYCFPGRATWIALQTKSTTLEGRCYWESSVCACCHRAQRSWVLRGYRGRETLMLRASLALRFGSPF